jgi:uncharacterized protein (TIGR02271 family)
MPVTGLTSNCGTINTADRPLDGSSHPPLDSAAWGCSDAGGEVSDTPLVVPVVEEALAVHTTPVETGRVRIRKIVHEDEEIVDPPLQRDEVVIERVPIERFVEGPISARSEGETLIIPVLEEVLVVEKRLLLKEEVRITTRRSETHTPQRVTRRREQVAVERIPREGDERNPVTEE